MPECSAGFPRRPPTPPREACGARSPIDNLSLVDRKTRGVGRRQARRHTLGAININRFPARAADQVMMVVAHAPLKPRGRSRRLDAPKNPLVAQSSQRVIDRLTGNCPDFLSDYFGNVVRGAVRPRHHCPHHRQSLRGHLHAMFTQGFAGLLSQGTILV